MPAERARLAKLRDRLQDTILGSVDEAFLNGDPERRLPHNLNISFAYVEGESVLMGLNKETALSSGSACTSATLEPSYVIAALGASAELAHSSIRFSLHRFNVEEEVDFVGRRTIEVVKRLREMSPLYELAKEGVDIKSIQWKRSEEHTSELQSLAYLVCRLLLEKKKKQTRHRQPHQLGASPAQPTNAQTHQAIWCPR